MIETQAANQLFFVILGLVLTSLFASTFVSGLGTNSPATRRYWLLSVGARAGSLFCVAAVPVLGPASAVVGNIFFIFSAGCLALLFRSWRAPLATHSLTAVTGFALAVGLGIELLRTVNPSFEMRMVLLGSASLAISAWELSELHKKIRHDPNPQLKLIAGVVVVQVLLSVASVASSFLYADPNIHFATDNGTTTMYVIWFTLGVHLVIYFFIGAYLYRRAWVGQQLAVEKKNEVVALLEERERLLSSLIVSNRIASTGALSASVAHEMSQPLTAAMLKLEMLRHLTQAPAIDGRSTHGLVNEVLDDIGRAKKVLEHLRSLFRQGPAKLETHDINQLIAHTIAIMRDRLEGHRITLRCTSSGLLHADIIEKEVQQVLINLLNNAVDSLDSVCHDEKCIVIDVTALHDVVRITVSENGPGIQPELAGSLFELARGNKPDGMGIGLWISRYIIEDHHRGTLYSDPAHTPGARFVIELPKARVPASPIRLPECAPD